MIIVTGASGQLGQAVAERLLQHIPADQIGVRGYPGILNVRELFITEEIRRIHRRRSIPRCVGPTPPT